MLIDAGMEIRFEASQSYNLPTILVQIIAGQLMENAMDQNCTSAELNVNSCNFRAMSPFKKWHLPTLKVIRNL